MGHEWLAHLYNHLQTPMASSVSHLAGSMPSKKNLQL